MIKIIEESLEQKIFDERAHHPLQSFAWGEARKKMGIETLRIAEYSNPPAGGHIANVFQLTFHKIPYTNYKIGYLPRSVFPSKNVLEFLYEYGKKNNIIFIKIEPYVILERTKRAIESNKEDPIGRFNNHRFLQDDKQSALKIVRSSHPLFPSWTQILNITKSDEELLKNMHSKTRYNIRLAQKKGVIVKEMSNEEGFKIFSKLYFATTRRQKYFGHTPHYHKLIWENLKTDIAHILIAFYANIPLAAYELFFFKKTLYYPYGGTSIEHRNVMAANLLMWETILLGKKLGAEKFDMWGSLPLNYEGDKAWVGFTRFKEGYGGKFVEFMGSYDLVVNTTLYKLYNLLNKARNYYLRLPA